MGNIFNSAVKSPYDVRDYTIKADTEFPETFSLETVPVKNQWTKPTCTAHALSSVCEYHHKRQHGWYTRFSTEFLYGLRENGYYIGDGMSIRDGLNTLLKYGNVFESDCDGNNNYVDAMNHVSKDIDQLREIAYPHRISGYFRVTSTEELKTSLIHYGPVVASMNNYEKSRIIDDVYTYDSTKDYGMHCVLIYGWNEKGWLVQNSWGYLHGGDGRFIIPFDFKFNEMWGIADDITEGLHMPRRGKVIDFIYNMFNKLVNMLRM